LTLSLVGYIGFDGRFIGGIKELPLIGNEAFILTDQKIHCIHNLKKDNSSLYISIAKTDIEEVPVDLPIDGIFNSHIAIFGNTGSGKSNTLASLYQGLFNVSNNNDAFQQNCKFLFLDFNGEYTKTDCITQNKKIYNLQTQNDTGNKIPVSSDELFDDETLSVLVEATDKTQKPFLKRALRFYKNAKTKSDFASYLKTIVQYKIIDILRMTNKEVAFKLLDYAEEVLDKFIIDEEARNLRIGIDFNNTNKEFTYNGTYLNTNPLSIKETNFYKAANSIDDAKISSIPELSQFYIFLHLQLIEDLFRYKVQNDHIYPVINRFKSKQTSIERTVMPPIKSSI